jgi:hypothetical protein
MGNSDRMRIPTSLSRLRGLISCQKAFPMHEQTPAARLAIAHWVEPSISPLARTELSDRDVSTLAFALRTRPRMAVHQSTMGIMPSHVYGHALRQAQNQVPNGEQIFPVCPVITERRNSKTERREWWKSSRLSNAIEGTIGDQYRNSETRAP